VVLALAPEIAHARRVVSLVVLHDAVLAVELLAIAALAALWVSVPSLPTLLVLAAVAIVAGVELVVDGRVPIAPVLGVVVVGVTIAVGRDDAAFAAVLVAGLATAVSWWVSGRPLTARVLLSVLGATILGVAGALAATADVVGSVGDLAVGPAGLVLFALGAAVAARARFRAEAMAVVWVAPLAALASSRSVAGGHGQLAGLGLAVGTVGLAAMAGTWCGAAPWRSRFLSRRMGEVRGRGRRMTCGGLCVATAVLAVVSTVAEPHAAFVGGLAVTTGEIAVTMALFGVRQWRFAPGARARGVTLGVLLALALPLGVDDGRPGILLALGLAVTAMLIVVAGPVTGLADAAHDRGVSGD
jgi:hypothetical protein